MQIKTLSLHNFKQYKDAEIKFPDGLTGFVGKNGAGKSTIFEAIYLALYGKFDLKNDRMRNDHAGERENVKIELEFEDKGTLYKIVRDFRGKALTPRADAFKDNESVVNGASEVTKYVQKILKIDAANFKNSFFSQQKEVTMLLSMKPDARQQQFRKMLGLSKLDTLESKVKDTAKDLNNELKGKQGSLLSEEKVNEYNDELKALAAKEELADKSLTEAGEKLISAEAEYKDIKRKQTELDKIKTEYDALDKEKKVTETESKNNSKNIEDTSNEINLLKLDVHRYNSLLPQKQKYNSILQEIECMQELEKKQILKNSIEENIKQSEKDIQAKNGQKQTVEFEKSLFDDREAKLDISKKLLSEQNDALKALRTSSGIVTSHIGHLNGQIKQKKERLLKIRSYGKESPCPECERPLGEHYDELIRNYENEISSFTQELETEQNRLSALNDDIEKKEQAVSSTEIEINNYKNEIKQRINLTKQINDLQTEIDKICKQVNENKKQLEELGDINFDENKLKAKQKEKEELKPYHDEALKLEDSERKLVKKEESLLNLNTDKEALKDKLGKIIKDIEELNYDQSKLDLVKDLRNKKEEEFNKAKDEKNSFEKEKISIAGRKSFITSELERDELLRREMNELNEKVELHDRLASFIKDFKSRLTSRELPAISAEASRLFTKVTKDRYSDLKITDAFGFSVLRDDNEVELDTLSGGEKDLAGLCLRIAISKRVSALAGRTNMGFLALDEVFGSQDEDRRDELMNSLAEISKDFKQIFVVSHNQDVQEAFSNRLEIKKSGNFSEVKLICN